MIVPIVHLGLVCGRFRGQGLARATGIRASDRVVSVISLGRRMGIHIMTKLAEHPIAKWLDEIDRYDHVRQLISNNTARDPFVLLREMKELGCKCSIVHDCVFGYRRDSYEEKAWLMTFTAQLGDMEIQVRRYVDGVEVCDIDELAGRLVDDIEDTVYRIIINSEYISSDVPLMEMFRSAVKSAEKRRFVGELIRINEISKNKHYRLISVTMTAFEHSNGTTKSLRYLLMVNPSTDKLHIEAVPSETESIEQALRFRNRSKEKPALMS